MQSNIVSGKEFRMFHSPAMHRGLFIIAVLCAAGDGLTSATPGPRVSVFVGSGLHIRGGGLNPLEVELDGGRAQEEEAVKVRTRALRKKRLQKKTRRRQRLFDEVVSI